MSVEVGAMDTWHVDFTRPDWHCPDCTWGADGSGGPQLLEPCELHVTAAKLRSTA